MQQITRGDYLKDLITIYIENNLQTDITELYSQFIFQCGEIQKTFTPAQVIKISFSEQESLKLKNLNTCYLAGITVEGHKETFNGSLTFNTRGEVVNYEPTASGSVTPAATETTCDCQGLRGFFSNCTQPAIKAYFSLNYVPTKLSELTNDTDYQDGLQVAESISIHNASTEAHPYIQSVISTETEALETAISNEAGSREQADNTLQANIDTETSLRVAATEALQGSINAETTAREQAVSLAISTTEAYADNSVSVHNSSTEAHPYIQGLISAEVTNRENADNNLQGQIDGLAASSDVTDIVGTYADLQAYDTQHLNNNDIIKVLSDETHDDEPSYYRFNKTAGTFSYIGSESASYTKAQADAKFVTQTTTINGEALSQNITLTATEVGALPSDTTINDLTTTAQQNALNSGVTSAVVSQVGTNTTAIATNTSAISTINGKIPTDASTTNKLVSAASLAASIANFANKDLNNLSTTGTQKLRSLNAYADDGELLTDADGLSFVKKYAHSTFDRSKFTIIGSPNITDDGIASGFSSSNRINIPTSINTSLTNANSWEFIIPFIATASGGAIFTNFESGGFTCLQNSNKVTVLLSSSGGGSNIGTINGSTTLTADTQYFVKVVFTGAQYYVQLSTDLKNWSNEGTAISSTTKVLFNSSLMFGYKSYWGQYTGSIDLKQFSITIDGAEVFSGNKTGVDTIKPDDYTVVGTPTISADGIASGFSSGNYVQKVLSTQLSQNDNYKITFGFTPNDITTIQDIFSLGGQYKVAPYFTINNSNLQITYKDSNSSQHFLFDTLVNNQLNILEIENINATTYIKLNGVLKHTLTDFANVIKGLYTLFVSQNFLGSIDLNAFKIYVDGNLVYQPCLKIPYTESKTGSKIVDSIYRDRVADMSAQFGYANYYTLQDEAKGNYTVVGTPTISADGVATNFSISNYITTQNKFMIDVSKSFEVHAKCSVKYIDGLGDTGVFRFVNTSNTNIARFNLRYNGKTFYLTSGGSGNDTGSTGIRVFTYNQDCDVDLIFGLNGTSFYCKIKRSYDSDWITLSTTTIDLTDNFGESFIEFGRGWGHYMTSENGSIDLKEFKIYVDNKLAYEAVTEPNFTLPQVEIYGLIGQRTLRDSYRDGINYWELYSNRDLEQGGSCTSGVEVTFARPFADTNYVLSVPYSAKSTTAFTPTQTGDWIAKGKGLL